MSLNENLILCSGVMPRFVNTIIKVEIPRKTSRCYCDIVVGEENGVQSYIDEAFVIEILFRLWTYEHNEWNNNMKRMMVMNIHLILNIGLNVFLIIISGSILKQQCVNLEMIGAGITHR